MIDFSKLFTPGHDPGMVKVAYLLFFITFAVQFWIWNTFPQVQDHVRNIMIMTIIAFFLFTWFIKELYSAMAKDTHEKKDKKDD